MKIEFDEETITKAPTFWTRPGASPGTFLEMQMNEKPNIPSMSVDELSEYIDWLEAELEHARAVLRGKRAALRNIEGKKGVEE